MEIKRLGGMLVLLVLLAFPASASMVTFLLIETGINEEAPISEITSLWEDGLMSVFFDAGHIVTNCPISRIEKRPAQDMSGFVAEDFDDAILGGADYFILGFLEYQAQPGKLVPVGIALRVYETSTKKLIHEQGFTAGRGRDNSEEYQYAQNAGRTIISRIKDM